jgi:hypothetical protein
MADEEEFNLEAPDLYDDAQMRQYYTFYLKKFEDKLQKFEELQKQVDELQQRHTTKIGLIRSALRDGMSIGDAVRLALRNHITSDSLWLSVDERIIAQRIDAIKQIIEAVQVCIKKHEGQDTPEEDTNDNTTGPPAQ